MTIELDEKLIGTWFVQLAGNAGHDDWMAGLSEGEEPGTFRFVHRFRYADPLEPGADPFEQIDRKSWHAAMIHSTTRNEVIASCRKIAAHTAAISGTTYDELMMNPQKDVKAFLDELAKKPWAHLKIEKL